MNFYLAVLLGQRAQISENELVLQGKEKFLLGWESRRRGRMFVTLRWMQWSRINASLREILLLLIQVCLQINLGQRGDTPSLLAMV